MVEHFLEAEGVAGSSPVLGTIQSSFILKAIMSQIRNIFAWLQKNERHVSTVVFVGGTTSDILTLSRVSISYAITILGIYITVAIAATIAEHYFYIHEAGKGAFLRGLRLTFAFIAEFMIGCLLSGCLVFYARSAAIGVSWPFVLFLIVILIGNEAFRNYRERLAFRCTLLFFTMYAYAIFTVPTLLGHISPYTFLESTAAVVAAFVLVLLGLMAAGWTRLQKSLVEIAAGIAAVLLVVNISYFTGIIPPLPLALRDVGVYHSVTYINTAGTAEYQVQAEASNDPWWDFAQIEPVIVHITPGEPVSVFSAVFAPTSFSTAVVHRWQEYDTQKHAWETKAVIAFAITGGRETGYRGYSTLSDLSAGKYRVFIETLSGQVIGQTAFTIQIVPTDPPLHLEAH
jgi:hypothetical protein